MKFTLIIFMSNMISSAEYPVAVHSAPMESMKNCESAKKAIEELNSSALWVRGICVRVAD